MENQENQTENILDNKERAYATGKRKNSIARVWLKRGSGDIKINGKQANFVKTFLNFKKCFCIESLIMEFGINY